MGYTVGVVRSYPRRLLGIAAVGAAATATVVAGRVLRVKVDGRSMVPTLWPGDRLVVIRGLRARPGDIVAVPDPRVGSRMLVKRVAAVEGDLRLRLSGDCATASTDSRSFGPVPARSVAGRVVWRYWPWEHRGPPGRARSGADGVR